LWHNLARGEADPYFDDWPEDGTELGEADAECCAAAVLQEVFGSDEVPPEGAGIEMRDVFGPDDLAPVGEGNDSPSSSSSSSTDSDSSASADERLTACSSTYEVRDELWRDCIMYRLKANAIHLFPKGSSGSKFVCGREKSCEHKTVRTSIHTESAICKQCRTGRPLKDAGAMTSHIDNVLKRLRAQ
jgi:hypothetical protein